MRFKKGLFLPTHGEYVLFQSKKAELETEVEVAAREKAELQAVTELQAVEIENLRKQLGKPKVCVF